MSELRERLRQARLGQDKGLAELARRMHRRVARAGADPGLPAPLRDAGAQPRAFAGAVSPQDRAFPRVPPRPHFW